MRFYPTSQQSARLWSEVTFERFYKVAWLLIAAAFVQAVFEFPGRLPAIPEATTLTIDGTLNLSHDGTLWLSHDGAVALSHDGSVEVTR